MKLPELGIADVIRAMTALKPGPRATEELVELCGLALQPELLPDAISDDITSDTGPESPDDAPLRVSKTEPAASLPPSVRRLEPVRQIPRQMAATTDPLASAPQRKSTGVFEGLLTVRDGTELLRHAASVPMAGNRIDLDFVVHELARARPLMNLPRLSVPSLALGTQVFVDVGRAMQPFFEDQVELLSRFEKNLRDRVKVRYFADELKRGAGPDRRMSSWTTPYELPDMGSPVIVVSDLGCGFPRRVAATASWMEFAELLRRRQSRMVVFAPVRPGRIPLALRRAIDFVLWDRSRRRRNVMQLAGAPGE